MMPDFSPNLYYDVDMGEKNFIIFYYRSYHYFMRSTPTKDMTSLTR